MGMTAKELAERIGGCCEGNSNVVIYGVAGIRDAMEGQVTFIANPRYIGDIRNTHASAIIIPSELNIDFSTIIRVTQPKMALIRAMEILTPVNGKPSSLNKGVHPLAFLGQHVKLGNNVQIGPYVVIEDDASIGANTSIYAGSYIGPRTQIGRDCSVAANVTIRDEIRIGDRVIIHSGTVIGCDGFGYTEVDGKHYKIPQQGTVIIEDDVEIGANVTVDRATFGKTWIKKGTKIDNLVQIAHNVVIGENCIIVAQVGIAGSTEIGDRVTLAGQVAVTGHIKIGSGTIVTGRSAVSKNIPSNVIVSGHPARLIKEDQKIRAHLLRLPQMSKRIQDLEHKIGEIMKNMNDQKNIENQ